MVCQGWKLDKMTVKMYIQLADNNGSFKDYMFIKRLKLKNYRLFNDIDISFQQGMNVLIGKNSTGKSTIIEALELLLGSVINIPIEEIIPYTKKDYPNIPIRITGTFEMSKEEKTSICSFLKNENDINLINNSHLEIIYSKTIIKEGKGIRITPNVQVNGNSITKNGPLLSQTINYLAPKIQANNILKVIDTESNAGGQHLEPLLDLFQKLPREPFYLNQYLRNNLFDLKQRNIEEYEKIKKKLLDAYPEMSDFDIELDINRAQLQAYFTKKEDLSRMPLESEGRGIREFFYLLLTLNYFPDTVILQDEAFTHMHKSLLNDFIASINGLTYQMITTSHIKELIKTLDFGNIIICRKHGGETMVKNLMEIDEIDDILDELGYSIEAIPDIDNIINHRQDILNGVSQ